MPVSERETNGSLFATIVNSFNSYTSFFRFFAFHSHSEALSFRVIVICPCHERTERVRKKDEEEQEGRKDCKEREIEVERNNLHNTIELLAFLRECEKGEILIH